MNKTLRSNKNTVPTPKWYLIDAKDKNLGRISTTIANILRGKNKTNYTPDQINNSYVIVINAKSIKVSGNKKDYKLYYKHSGRPGGLKTESFEKLQKRIPNRIIEKAVKGMLPKNTLGRQLFTHLKIYNESVHPYKNQKLKKL